MNSSMIRRVCLSLGMIVLTTKPHFLQSNMKVKCDVPERKIKKT